MEKETKLDDAVSRFVDLCYLKTAMAVFEQVQGRDAMDCPSFFADWLSQEARRQVVLLGMAYSDEERIVNLFWDLVSDE